MSTSTTINARSPSAFALSALIHGLFVGVAVWVAQVVKDQLPPETHIIELVAGEGDNYMATEAPALGSPNPTVKVDIPATPLVSPAPEPEPIVQPAPPPVEAVPVPAPKPKPVPMPKPKNFEKMIDQRLDKIDAKLEKQRKEEEKKRREYEEHLKRIASAKTPPGKNPTSGKTPQLNTEGIAKGVLGGSVNNKIGGAGGKALTASEASALDRYYSMLQQRIQDAHEKPIGLTDAQWSRGVRVSFSVTASGTIINVKIIQSSGSKEFDESALAALRNVRSIGAVPGGKGFEWKAFFGPPEEE